MPTEYTSCFKTGGASFKQFATLCVRAFGACAVQHGQPTDQPPKTQKPDVREYVNGLRRAKRQLTSAKKLRKSLITHRALLAAQEEYKRAKSTIDAANKLRHDYDRMLREVRAWVPPSSDHEVLKKFMIEQLQTGIELDCRIGFSSDELTRITDRMLQFDPEKERETLIESAEHDIDYFSKHILEITERTENRNKWLTDALESFEHPRFEDEKIKGEVCKKVECRDDVPCESPQAGSIAIRPSGRRRIETPAFSYATATESSPVEEIAPVTPSRSRGRNRRISGGAVQRSLDHVRQFNADAVARVTEDVVADGVIRLMSQPIPTSTEASAETTEACAPAVQSEG